MKYQSGDIESFKLILSRLPRRKIGVSRAQPEVWRALPHFMKLFLVFNPKLLPAKASSPGTNLSSLQVKTGLQSAARANFGYGEKGAVQTSLLVLSIIDSVDKYFADSTRHGKQKAYHSFRARVEKTYKLRRYLMTYNETMPETGSPDYFLILKKLRRLGASAEILGIDGLGQSLLSISHYCGTRSSKRDLINFSIIKSMLSKNGSMLGFLGEFINHD